MTYQEVLWKGKIVWVTGILSYSGRMHMNLKKYVGRAGMVIGESKNGQLLVKFKGHTRCIPAGCLTEYGTIHQAGLPLKNGVQ
jgi:hypothetical protein